MAELRPNVASSTADRGDRFLLIVDSDADSRFYLAALLQRFNYQTCAAKTAQEALQVAAIAVPSLVITARDLKDMDAVDLMRNFKQDPRTAGVPLIVMINQDDQDATKHCLELGAGSLSQPVDPEQLYQAVQTAVEVMPRANIRIRTLLPVKVENMPVDCPEGVCTTELSKHGMFLRTTTLVPVSTRFSLQIYLYGQIITAEAKVIYSCRGDGEPHYPAGMGLKFVQLAPKDQQLIRQFIRGEVTRGIARGTA